MHTLLLDNYDSFTYNLFHYLAEVNGREPTLLLNDAPAPTPDELREFDNIVISPGPGRPERPGDFGLCRAVIETASVPLLGVCLGHQGLCHALGGAVDHAPQVRHGRTSPVHHGGDEIFAGLPSPFSAVRYHSLMVSELPADLEPVAYADDGVLMAVRHRTRPMWGLQFHPESICTEDGHRLLGNFRDLTERWHGARPGRTRPAGAVPRVAAPDEGTVAPSMRVLHRELPTRAVDEVAFDALFRGSRHPFWLDSSTTRPDTGRFSIMGDAAGPLARVAVADVWAGTVTVESASGAETVTSPFFDWLDAELRRLRVEVPPLPFGFALGWVGYLGYELKAECGGDRRHRSTEPDAAMVFADRAVVFDHVTSRTHLLALAAPGPGGSEPAAREWLDATETALGGLAGAAPEPIGDAPPARTVALRHDRERYLALIAACHRAIEEGESYEVCLTNMLEVAGHLDPWDCYRRMRAISPAPFGAFLHIGPAAVLSTSPERFLRVSGSGVVESKPIKGTRPRAASPGEDEALRRSLASDEKDRSENLMIVDLVRNDLGRSAEVGSVSVRTLFDVETYATVHQLVSTVQARLHAEATPVSCVRAAFPGGSMTGAPKIRTMRLVDELEEGPRGVYSGAVGYFSLSGEVDLSIVIRTLVITGERAAYGVGGAIVALSDAEAEFEETAVKAAPVLGLLGAQFPGRGPAQASAAARAPLRAPSTRTPIATRASTAPRP